MAEASPPSTASSKRPTSSPTRATSSHTFPTSSPTRPTSSSASNRLAAPSNSSNITHHATHLRPALFVGPPSRDASSQSLLQPPPPGHTSSSARVPLLRQRTFHNDGETPSTATGLHPDSAASTGNRLGGGGEGQQRDGKPVRQRPTTEAIWAEMQNTLEEVELAGMSGANVFGAEHARALDELREAQVELAKAWARSEGDEGDEESSEGLEGGALTGNGDGDEEVGSGTRASMDAGDKSSTLKAGRNSIGSKGKGPGGLGSTKTPLEEGTEYDIMLARKRRLANDKYFERVSKGVADVVARLAIVADKMGGVETESQEIWGDKDSVEVEARSSN